MFGILPSQEIEQVLRSECVGRLGCHADGITYIVPVSYAYNGGYVYVHTQEGKKLNMLRKNPAVCFQVDTMRDMGNWKSVIAWGQYEELGDQEDRNNGLRILIDRELPFVSSETAHLSPQWPFPPNKIGEIKGIVFRILLTDKTGRFELHQPNSVFAS